MDEILTMREIRERYDSEWVVIADPELNESLEVLRGRVLFHGKDPERINHIPEADRPSHSAVLFLGDPSEDMEFVL